MEQICVIDLHIAINFVKAINNVISLHSLLDIDAVSRKSVPALFLLTNFFVILGILPFFLLCSTYELKDMLICVTGET